MRSLKRKMIVILLFVCSFAHAQTDEAYKLYNKANALFNMKQYKEAIPFFDKAIALNPKIRDVYAQRGTCYHQTKNFDKAMENYKKDEATNPAHSSYNMACALSLLGKKEEALKWLEISQKSGFRQLQTTLEADADFENIKKDPRFIKIATTDYSNEYDKLIAAGDKSFYNEKPDYTLAAEMFSKVITKDPKNPLGYRARGNSYKSLNEIDKANKDLDKSIELKDKEMWYSYLLKADMIVKTNDKLAFTYYQKAYELNPAWEGSFDAAACYYKNGKKDEAISIMQQIEDNYNNAEFLYYTAYFMFQKGGQDALALEYANKALASDPNFMYAYETRAGIYFQLKKYEESISDYTRVIENNPKNGMAYFRRGTSKVSLMRKKEACEDWKMGISLGYKDENNYYADFCK